MQHRKTIWLFVLMALIFLAVTPALAQRPSVTITPIWRPGEQLSTLVSEDDYRYVDIQLMMTGNMQFWAVNFGCQFTPNVLAPYTVVAGGDPHDDLPVVTWGPEWGVQDSDFFAVDSDPTDIYPGFDYEGGRGTLTIRATRLGNVSPLGINGTEYNLLVATIRLRVADLGTNLVNTSASVRCNPLEFYNRDGNQITRGRQGRVSNLVVRSGYSISGQALLQASRTHDGIEVECDNGGGPIATTSDRNGNFTFGSSDPIREFGEYECTFTRPITSVAPGQKSEFLPASTQVLLNFPTQALLPVILKGGNVDPITGGSQNDIDSSDLFQFTTNWAPGSVSNAYDGLDVNGDKRINEADLAMFAGNYDDPGDNEPVDASHLFFGLATDYGGTFPNSRVFWGDSQAGPVQMMVDSRRERGFWPAMAPDGETFAYIETISRSGQYMLLTSPTSRPRGRALLNSRSFTNDALAPSWSPDGQRLAFICSWKASSTGLHYNEGNLCVVNADGSNFQQVATYSKIYPPAWFDNNVVIYAGLDDHPVTNCQDNLCFIDLATNASGPVSAGFLSDDNDVADMPAITSYDKGGPTYQKVLMYRFWNGTDNEIKAHEISYDGAAFNIATTVTAITSPNFIDYYDVSPFMDIVFTEFALVAGTQGTEFRTLDIFHNRTFNLDGSPALSDGWSVAGSHTVDGFVGNPTASVGLFAGQPWNGSLSRATLFHAERATVEWLP